MDLLDLYKELLQYRFAILLLLPSTVYVCVFCLCVLKV